MANIILQIHRWYRCLLVIHGQYWFILSPLPAHRRRRRFNSHGLFRYLCVRVSTTHSLDSRSLCKSWSRKKKSDKPGRFIEVLRCMHLTFYFNQPLYSAHIRPISQTASSCWKSLTIRLPTFNFSYTQSIVIASREEEAARGKNR